MNISNSVRLLLWNKTLTPIYKGLQTSDNNLILDPLSVVITLAINAFKPIGTKLSIYNGCLHLHDSGILQSTVRSISGDSKMNIKIINHPLIYACKQFFNNSNDNATPESIIYLFKTAKNGLYNLLYTYNDNREIKTCLHTYINIINEVLSKKTINYEMLDLLIKLNTGTVDVNNEVNVVGEVKSNLINTLHKTWDTNKITIVINLLHELEDATPFNKSYIFQSLDAFMMSIHEKTREKTQVFFEGNN